ncbi:hypothetical protein [Methylacidiphilum caldifontis]|uniref:Uncharacterized protein n=1 Tax=Methylacidiphilum caldifontis TaxID=2795386 RepID=A0A4Y8PHZ6_9BACT|nr:hypothetical protein [Methylacidiphilum caldifontis]TFE71542.1 hypothetical protein A7Q10_04395 [Methylacidiphilum caldifontis]
MQVGRYLVPYSELNKKPKEWREAFLKLGWIITEANWLRKLLMIATIQNPDPGSVELPASLWLSAITITTLCGKIHEGWKLINDDNEICKKINALEQSDKDFDYKGKKQKLDQLLDNKSFIAKIRHNIGFHYQYCNFDNWPPILKNDPCLDNDPLLSILLTDKAGDLLSGISLIPLLETTRILYKKNHSQKVTNLDELIKDHIEAAHEIMTITADYCAFITRIFLEMFSEIIKSEIKSSCHPQLENVDKAPLYNEQKIYFFMTPPF